MRTYLFLVLGGVGIGLSLSFPPLWPLVFFLFVPILASVYRGEVSRRELFFHGWVFGTALIGSTLHWFFNTLPLVWLGVTEPLASVAIVFLFWAILSALLGLVIAAWTLIARIVCTNRFVDVFSFSILWVVFEHLRMWVYALVSYGPGAALEPHFSFGFVGYALAHDSLLLQIASVGGVYALSLAAMMVAMVFYFVATKVPKTVAAGIVLSVFALSIFAPQQTGSFEPPFNMDVIETNFESVLEFSSPEQQYKQDMITQKLHELVRRNPGVDVIVLPEASRYTQFVSKGDFVEFFADIFGDKEVLIVDSWRVTTDEGVFNRIVFFSTTEGVLAAQDKLFLLPMGEYVTHFGGLIVNMLGKSDELKKIKKNRSYTHSNTLQPFTFRGVTIGALACSEVVSPSLYHSLAEDYGVDVFVNLSSYAWFNHSVNPYNQVVAMARVQAVWGDRPYIQASNAAPSFFVSPEGRVGTKQL